jgi:hypothetical protein
VTDEGGTKERWRITAIAGSAVLVAALAALGYVLFVKVTHPLPSATRTKRLSQLVIVNPGVSGVDAKPKQAAVIPSSSSNYALVKQLGSSDPDDTATYGRNWQSASDAANEATIFVDILPTTADAASVRNEAVQVNTKAKSFTSENFTLDSHFAVPGVPGSVGAAYTIAASSTSPAGKAYTAVYQFDRAVVSLQVQTDSTGLTEQDASTIASAEYRLLERVEPGFALAQTSRPATASIVYGVVALLLVMLVIVVPGIVRRSRRAHHINLERRARYQYTARGRKTVRRQRSPDWARSRR